MTMALVQNLAKRAWDDELTLEDIKLADPIKIEQDTYIKRSVLYIASKRCSVDIVEAILDKGIDVNGLSGRNMTALHSAASAGKFDNVILLLRRGADAKLCNDVSSTYNL
jgi:ankyrin repeat protein